MQKRASGASGLYNKGFFWSDVIFRRDSWFSEASAPSLNSSWLHVGGETVKNDFSLLKTRQYVAQGKNTAATGFRPVCTRRRVVFYWNGSGAWRSYVDAD